MFDVRDRVDVRDMADITDMMNNGNQLNLVSIIVVIMENMVRM